MLCPNCQSKCILVFLYACVILISKSGYIWSFVHIAESFPNKRCSFVVQSCYLYILVYQWLSTWKWTIMFIIMFIHETFVINSISYGWTSSISITYTRLVNWTWFSITQNCVQFLSVQCLSAMQYIM